MNINDYEALAANPAVLERIRSKTFYAMGKAKDPHFTAVWADVPEEVRVAAGEVGFEIILALVDDYTTPGCDCGHCTWDGESTQVRPVMCRQRWLKLSPEERAEIAESIEG